MAYFSTNAICFKKKKIHIWAWIKLIINTLNVSRRIRFKWRLPPPSQRAWGAGGLHNFPFSFSYSKTQFAPEQKPQTRGFGGCSPGQGPRLLPPQCFLSMKLQHLPKHRAKNIGVRWSAAFVKSQQRKRSPNASTSLLSTENCWTRGSWW